MKTKRVLILLLIAASMVFSGCDAINGTLDSVFLSTPEVKAADLDNFTGNTPTTDTEVFDGFMFGVMVAMSPAVNLLPRSLGSDYEEVARVLDLTIPGFAESRAAEVDSRSASFSVNASINDESIESDYDPYDDTFDPGDLTVTEASVKAEVKVDSLDPDKMTESQADIEAKLELIIKNAIDYDYNSISGNYDLMNAKINEMNLNVNAKGNLKAAIGTNGPEEVDFYAAADVSIGFSLTVPDGNYSGKYIINFNYIQSGTVTANDIEDGEFTGDAEEVALTIEVYDNSNNLVRSAAYNQTELMDMFDGGM